MKFINFSPTLSIKKQLSVARWYLHTQWLIGTTIAIICMVLSYDLFWWWQHYYQHNIPLQPSLFLQEKRDELCAEKELLCSAINRLHRRKHYPKNPLIHLITIVDQCGPNDHIHEISFRKNRWSCSLYTDNNHSLLAFVDHLRTTERYKDLTINSLHREPDGRLRATITGTAISNH